MRVFARRLPLAPAPLTPFGRTIADCPLVDSTVAERQRRALREAGVIELGEQEPDPIDQPILRFDPSLCFSAAFLAHFLELSLAQGGPTVAAVTPGRLHDAFGKNVLGLLGAPGDDEALIYPMFLEPAGGSQDSPRPILVPLANLAQTRPQPGRMDQPIVIPLEPKLIWRIAHWSDLLVVNLVLLAVEAAALPAEGSRADDVEVHPTAYVTGSHLGRGVRIGPFALVQNAWLEEGCVVEEHASVVRSHLGAGTVVQDYAQARDCVIGAGTVVSFRCSIRAVVVLGGSTLSSPVLTRAVVGEGAFLGRSMTLSVAPLQNRPISVWSGGRRVDTGMPMLGCAIGDGARLGTVALPAGFEVPAGYYLTRSEINRLPPDLPRRVPLVELNGAFRSMQLRPRTEPTPLRAEPGALRAGAIGRR